ncbi:MAG: DMT family transporter [Spirochaetia bacterium]|jgi:drug/metabolite transporter (DMT)-like permease|nr:DMT family transporter [Spirochaetia bacterium]
MQTLYGFLLIFVSAVSFGAVPIFTEYVYREGVNTQSLLFLRFAIASLFIWIIVLSGRKKLPAGKDVFILFLLGFLGYSGQSFSYFKALTFIPPALVAILLYLYPVFVTLLSIFILKEQITQRKIIALFLAVTGTILVIGIQKGTDIRGILLGISAAVIYSVYIITSSKVLKRNNTLSSTAVITTSSAFFFLIFSLNTELILPSSSFGWINMTLIAVVSTAIAVYAFFAGVKLIGAVNSSMISTFEPVATMFLASAVFSYKITVLQIEGTVLIIAAAILLSLREKRTKLPEKTDSGA